MTLISEIVKTSIQVQNQRSIDDVLIHAMTELGELAEEVQIAQGNSYKQSGPDGVIGEALDVIACMVDVIYLYGGVLADEEHMLSVIRPKLEKWKEKDKLIQDTKLESQRG